MRVRYFLTLATGLLECLCFCGVLFGWSSLVFILKEERFFSLQCVNATDEAVAQFQGQFLLFLLFIVLLILFFFFCLLLISILTTEFMLEENLFLFQTDCLVAMQLC